MEKRSWSWACTVITQLCLCFALYIALNLGQPQSSLNTNATPHHLYFISVKGGFRPLTQQFHLLKQMEKVTRTYKASFIVSSSELGEYDPLMQNATQHFPHLRLPWYTTYTTTASQPKGREVGCFAKKIKISNGRNLDVIGVDTELLQDSVLRGMRSLSGNRNNQLHWLIRTLEANNSNWYGGSLLDTNRWSFVERDMYLSGQDCTSQAIDGSGVAYIGNPSSTEAESYSVFLNGNSVFQRELTNGFLLHRVSSVQIVTYYINFAGEVAYKTVLQQKGREIV